MAVTIEGTRRATPTAYAIKVIEQFDVEKVDYEPINLLLLATNF